MKKVVAIFLSMYHLLGSVIPGNSFFELSSLPSLIKHYQFHRTAESPGISFAAFLKLHYSNSKHKNSDPKNHCNLPLQHQGNSVPLDEIVNLFSPSTQIFQIHFLNKIYFPLNSFAPDNQFSSGVFHPPSVLS